MSSAKLAIAVNAIVRFDVTRQRAAINPGMMVLSHPEYVIAVRVRL